jgi:AcrR family transcriptional regulator
VGRKVTYHHGDLRAALVTAAVELVAEKGVAGLSVAEAARRAGVSSAAPYRHFASRTALLSAAASAAGRRLSEQMQAAVEEVRASRTGDGDPVTQAVETLAALAAVYVRYALANGAAFELILADELQTFPDAERRDVTRTLFDQLLWPAVTITGDVMAANPLLRSFTAVVHGYAYLPRARFGSGFPTDMRGFATEGELVADEAARAVRTLARAAAGQR